MVINLVSLTVCTHFRLTLRTGRYQCGGIDHATEEGLMWAMEYVSGCVAEAHPIPHKIHHGFRDPGE